MKSNWPVHRLLCTSQQADLLYMSSLCKVYIYIYVLALSLASTMDILRLRWIARFALKEGHSCRICHCVHFTVQFAELFFTVGDHIKMY